MNQSLKLKNLGHSNAEDFFEDHIFTPTPTPDFISKDFPSAPRSRMEILTKENLVGTKAAPTAVSRTFPPLVRRKLGFLSKDFPF